jgi:hypothetical protein
MSLCMIDWQLEPFIIEACHLFECISDWSSRKVHRNANCLVHNLDRYALSHQWDPIFQQSQSKEGLSAFIFYFNSKSHVAHMQWLPFSVDPLIQALQPNFRRISFPMDSLTNGNIDHT